MKIKLLLLLVFTLFSCKDYCTTRYFAKGYNVKVLKRTYKDNNVYVYIKNDYFIIKKKLDDRKDSIEVYDCYCGKEYYGTFLK